MVGSGILVGLTMDVWYSEIVQNSGIINHAQLNGRTGGTSYFGAVAQAVTNSWTLCLSQMDQNLNSNVSGPGCYVVGTNSLFNIVYNNVYLTDDLPRHLHISNFVFELPPIP